jgi:exosortase
MNSPGVELDDRDSDSPEGTPWVLPLILAASVVVLYGDVVVRLAADWFQDENYSHGILVPPAIAWLLWRRRADLQNLERRPSHWGSVVVAASLVVFLVGQAALEFFLTRVSLVGVLAGAVVQLLGWRHLRICLFPLLLLILAIPLPALIFNQVAVPMQLVASRFGVATLEALSIPALREGNVILLERATLEVAEACSGVRSLISLGTLALFYGYIGGQTAFVRATVAVSVLPVVIIANGLRVAGAGIAAHFYGPAAAAGFLHSFSGWLFFGSALLMLVAVERGAAAIRWPRGPEPSSVAGHG